MATTDCRLILVLIVAVLMYIDDVVEAEESCKCAPSDKLNNIAFSSGYCLSNPTLVLVDCDMHDLNKKISLNETALRRLSIHNSTNLAQFNFQRFTNLEYLKIVSLVHDEMEIDIREMPRLNTLIIISNMFPLWLNIPFSNNLTTLQITKCDLDSILEVNNINTKTDKLQLTFESNSVDVLRIHLPKLNAKLVTIDIKNQSKTRLDLYARSDITDTVMRVTLHPLCFVQALRLRASDELKDEYRLIKSMKLITDGLEFKMEPSSTRQGVNAALTYITNEDFASLVDRHCHQACHPSLYENEYYCDDIECHLYPNSNVVRIPDTYLLDNEKPWLKDKNTLIIDASMNSTRFNFRLPIKTLRLVIIQVNWDLFKFEISMPHSVSESCEIFIEWHNCSANLPDIEYDVLFKNCTIRDIESTPPTISVKWSYAPRLKTQVEKLFSIFMPMKYIKPRVQQQPTSLKVEKFIKDNDTVNAMKVPDSNWHSIAISNSETHELKIQFPKLIENLYLSANTYKFVPYLIESTNLAELVMSSNQIVELSSIVELPTSITLLDFSNNLIQSISWTAFARLPKLTKLVLSKNRIKLMDSFDMRNLGLFDLSNNFIESIDRLTFSEYVEDVVVLLDSNKLKRLPTIELESNASIKLMNFSYQNSSLEFQSSAWIQSSNNYSVVIDLLVLDGNRIHTRNYDFYKFLNLALNSETRNRINRGLRVKNTGLEMSSLCYLIGWNIDLWYLLEEEFCENSSVLEHKLICPDLISECSRVNLTKYELDYLRQFVTVDFLILVRDRIAMRIKLIFFCVSFVYLFILLKIIRAKKARVSSDDDSTNTSNTNFSAQTESSKQSL